MLHLLRHARSKQGDSTRKYRDEQNRNYQNEPSFAEANDTAEQFCQPAQKDREQHRGEDQQDHIESEIDKREDQQRENDKTYGEVFFRSYEGFSQDRLRYFS